MNMPPAAANLVILRADPGASNILASWLGRLNLSGSVREFHPAARIEREDLVFLVVLNKLVQNRSHAAW